MALDIARAGGAGGTARPRIGRWLRVAATLGLLGTLLALVDLTALARIVAAADPGPLALTLGLFVVERLFAAYRWLVLLRVAEPGVRFGPVLRVTLISNFFGTFLPGSVGIEILRVHGLSRALSDLPLALSSVLMERLCGLFTVIMWIGVGLVVAPIGMPYAVDVVAGSTLILLIAVATALLHERPRRTARRLLPTLGLGWIGHRLTGLESRLDAYARRPGALLWSLGLAFVFQLVRIGTVALAARALGIGVDPLLFTVIVPATILIALLPISIGGFGARQVSYVALLGIAGVAPEPALVLGLTREFLNFAACLPGGLLYALGPAPRDSVKEST